MLLGNKADMTEQRVIKKEDGERLARVGSSLKEALLKFKAR